MAYLLDANVFIEAKNRYYAFDLCPGFWEWLERENKAGNVLSIDRVGEELQGRDDRLAEWARSQGATFFVAPDASVLPSMAAASEWLRSQRYRPGAVNDFLQEADFFLVVHARAHGHTIVTHELPGNSEKQVKIPEVCVGLQVPFIQTFDMLRRARARFVLAP